MAADSNTPAASTITGADNINNPMLATYDGGSVSLNKLEEYAREMPIGQRIPFADGAGKWREFMSGQLAKMNELTSQALQMGIQLDPGYLRARDYFIQEYMAYLIIRDKLTNSMDLSMQAQKNEYETHKSDYWLSSTVTLRVIRTRSADKIASASKALKDGADFEKMELKFSQVSPRYRGRVLGPFPIKDDRTIIPPPDEAINAAFATKEGETTGPLDVRGFYFLVKTIKKTAGRQQSLPEVAEDVEQSLRDRESQTLVPALVDQIQKDLGASVDETLFTEGTNPNDLLATIGAFKLYRHEYTDMNGNVRGPATQIATGMPTKLKQFVLPYMISEWAKMHGYLDRAETKKALHYYDLQHLSSNVEMMIQDKMALKPSDEELEARFKAHIDEFRRPGGPEPKFEDFKQEMLNASTQQQAPDNERRVTGAVLSKLHFKMLENPVCANITALEALTAAKDQLPENCRLLEIAPMRYPGGNKAVTQYEDIGRAPDWLIRYQEDGKSSPSEVIISGPQPLLQKKSDFASVPAFKKWERLLRFDTDALKRHAIDKGLGDFMAKHNNKVKAGAKVEFSYSKDDPTSPSYCLIIYTATPLDTSSSDGFTMKYSGDKGEVVKRRFGQDPGECLICPKPDLPSPAILQSTTSGSTEISNFSEKGDL